MYICVAYASRVLICSIVSPLRQTCTQYQSLCTRFILPRVVSDIDRIQHAFTPSLRVRPQHITVFSLLTLPHQGVGEYVYRGCSTVLIASCLWCLFVWWQHLIVFRDGVLQDGGSRTCTEATLIEVIVLSDEVVMTYTWPLCKWVSDHTCVSMFASLVPFLPSCTQPERTERGVYEAYKCRNKQLQCNSSEGNH